MKENDPHDMLVQSYLAYFKANENFEARNSVRTHALSRKLLRDIRKYAKLRMEEIHTKHKTKKEAEEN
tara:strand:+ start:412 stop:615 length:204 start_codon:yes stop_codon:yes gene_type:complete